MRLGTIETEHDAQGFQESEEVGINPAFASRIFTYLSQSLYSRPHESMLRELACNALDEAPHANGKPFDITLPSRMSSQLVIRDHGRGMDHDFIMRRAMSLGDSTKRDTNEAIGGFGLGLKTPFAITDQFSITVYRGYEAQTYIIDRAGGLPRVHTSPEMVRELPSHETGTEIVVPCEEQHFDTFRRAAQRILYYFPPGSFACYGAQIEQPRYAYECETYALDAADGSNYVQMGAVAYPLDIGVVLLTDDYNENVRRLPSMRGVTLRMPIGSVSLVPNREAIEYNDTTRAAIRAQMVKVFDEVVERVEKSIEDAPTLYAAQLAYMKAYSQTHGMSWACPHKIKWRDEEMTGIRIARIPPKNVEQECEEIGPDGKKKIERVFIPSPEHRPKFFAAHELRNYKKAKPWSGEEFHRAASTGAIPLIMAYTDEKRIHDRARIALDEVSGAYCGVLALDAKTVARLEIHDAVQAADFEPPKIERTASTIRGMRGFYKRSGSCQFVRVDGQNMLHALDNSEDESPVLFICYNGADADTCGDTKTRLFMEALRAGMPWAINAQVYGFTKAAQKIVKSNDEAVTLHAWDFILKRAHEHFTDAEFVEALHSYVPRGALGGNAHYATFYANNANECEDAHFKLCAALASTDDARTSLLSCDA